MVIRKEDLYDLDIFDSFELASDGYYIFLQAINKIVSTNSSTKIVTITGFFLNDKDNPIEPGDRVLLLNTFENSSDGYYIIDSIIDTTSFKVVENINDSIGGDGYFMFVSGAKKIGFDPTGLSTTTSKNLQDAVKDIANNSSGISASSHKILRQLIHFIDDGPADGFISGSFKEIIPSSNPFPTSIIWWESSLKIKKILEKYYTYNSNKTINQVQWKMYDIDGITIISTITDTITYNGVFEINRTRIIS